MKSTKFFLFSALALCATPTWADPGDPVLSVDLPVVDFGVSVASNCDGEIYYTNGNDFRLHKTDANGTNLGFVLIIDSATGAALEIDEMAWDESRHILWGQLHGSNPVAVYTINATTGAASFAFNSITLSIGSFRDGIAYDPSDDTLWISGDVSTTIEHYMTDGTFLNQITPTAADGNNLGTISGVEVGVGDLLYLGRNGLTEIVQVQKSTGNFISVFSSPSGARDEGLECDAASFSPLVTLWSRDVNGFIFGTEVEEGTCECGVVTCTLGFWKNHPEEWLDIDPDGVPSWGGGLTYMEIFDTPPKKGDASVMLAHAYLAALLNNGAEPVDLADASALLELHPIGSGDLEAGKNADPDRAVALAIMEELQAFNESAECQL